jgi:hypothetical protein
MHDGRHADTTVLERAERRLDGGQCLVCDADDLPQLLLGKNPSINRITLAPDRES